MVVALDITDTLCLKVSSLTPESPLPLVINIWVRNCGILSKKISPNLALEAKNEALFKICVNLEAEVGASFELSLNEIIKLMLNK